MNTTRPEIILIAALARNRVIGRDNALPWRLRGDLVHFKATTGRHPLLMGRKTWESLGRPLPGRRNLVVSGDPGYRAEGAETFPTPDAALQAIDGGKVFVIGGAELYRQLLDRADVLMLTEIDAEVTGDARFPEFDRSLFSGTSRGTHEADADNDYPFEIVEYRRRPA
jgi:dihydrofolate reductase